MRSFIRSIRKLSALFALLVLMDCSAKQSLAPGRPLDVPYEPTHPEVVRLMLEAAKIGRDDVVYDLGCGDGRIAIEAVRRYGARAVCIDLHPDRIREARAKARDFGVADRIEFIVGDIFAADLRPATVVTMYLTTRVNRWLRPKLLSQLRPGTRIVSHAFHLSEWQPDRTLRHSRARGGVAYYYVVPGWFAGTYRWDFSGAAHPLALVLEQDFQKLSGTLRGAPGKFRLLDGKVQGLDFLLTVSLTNDWLKGTKVEAFGAAGHKQEFRWQCRGGRMEAREPKGSRGPGRQSWRLRGTCKPEANDAVVLPFEALLR